MIYMKSVNKIRISQKGSDSRGRGGGGGVLEMATLQPTTVVAMFTLIPILSQQIN